MARAKSESIRIYNSSKQMIPIQVRSPKGDFYASEQQIRLLPGKDVLLPKSHIMQEQVDNLAKRRMIRVIYETAE